MKLWSDFYDYYLGDVPGCSYAAAVNALRMAAQEFCERAKVWRVIMDPVTTVAGNQVYPFDLTADQEIVKILLAKMDGHDIDLLLYDQLDNARRGMIVLDQRQFHLQPMPATGNILVITAVLKPSNSAPGVDDVIWASYAEGIAFGAKARLFKMKSKPYFDPVAAADNKNDFNEAIGKATIKAAKAFSSAPIRTRAAFM